MSDYGRTNGLATHIWQARYRWHAPVQTLPSPEDMEIAASILMNSSRHFEALVEAGLLCELAIGGSEMIGYMPRYPPVTKAVDPEHECDWRFYRRRDDGLAEVLCVALGHDVNTRFRIAPMVVDNEQLPKYEGQFDLPHATLNAH